MGCQQTRRKKKRGGESKGIIGRVVMIDGVQLLHKVRTAQIISNITATHSSADYVKFG
jgi:hypothetical protein